MLELMILCCLSKSVGRKAHSRGLSRLRSQMLLWLFWVGGGVCGVLVGSMLSGMASLGLDSPGRVIGSTLGIMTTLSLLNVLSMPKREGRRWDFFCTMNVPEDFPGFDHSQAEATVA